MHAPKRSLCDGSHLITGRCISPPAWRLLPPTSIAGDTPCHSSLTPISIGKIPNLRQLNAPRVALPLYNYSPSVAGVGCWYGLTLDGRSRCLDTGAWWPGVRAARVLLNAYTNPHSPLLAPWRWIVLTPAIPTVTATCSALLPHRCPHTRAHPTPTYRLPHSSAHRALACTFAHHLSLYFCCSRHLLVKRACHFLHTPYTPYTTTLHILHLPWLRLASSCCLFHLPPRTLPHPHPPPLPHTTPPPPPHLLDCSTFHHRQTSGPTLKPATFRQCRLRHTWRAGRDAATRWRR